MHLKNPNPVQKKSNYYLEKYPSNKCREKIVLNGLPLWHFSCLQIVSPTHIYLFSIYYIMESIRQKQIGEVIRRYFSMILSEEGVNIYGRSKLVTLTGVKMTPDLLVAKLYISVYGTENKQEVILQLEDNHTALRQALAAKVGKQMRRVPDIEIYLDDTIDEMYRVNDLLNRVGDEDKNLGQ